MLRIAGSSSLLMSFMYVQSHPIHRLKTETLFYGGSFSMASILAMAHIPRLEHWHLCRLLFADG